MPYNGNGVFVRGYSWVNDATNSIPISAPRMDADTNDICTNGLGNALTRDGQGVPTANLPMSGFKHTGAAPGVSPTDYATMAQISGFAPLNSPSFTGTPIAPTASPGNNSTQIATTAFVVTAIASYLPLSGGTVTGPVVFSNTTNTLGSAFFNSGITFTSAGGAVNYQGGQLLYDAGSNNLGVRFGSPASFKFASFNNDGSFNALSGNVTTSGIFVAGGINQPTIFVQAGTPTARNVGDLWFF